MTAINSSIVDRAEIPPVAADRSFFGRYIFSTDHKVVGVQFMFLSLMFMVIGGLLAMLIRWQLAWPDELAASHPVPILGNLLHWPGGVMPSDFYLMVVSMHATIMIFFVVIPLLVGAFGNFLIPLMIGAGDMAFPLLNGFSFWLATAAGAVLLAGLFLPGNAAQAGWTSYPPLSAIHQSAHWVPYLAPTNFADQVADFFRVHDAVSTSPWPLAPLLMIFATFAAVGFYVLTNLIQRWSGNINRSKKDEIPLKGMRKASAILAGAAVVLIVAYFITHGVQYCAYDGQSCWFLSLLILGVSSILAAVTYLSTIIGLRCAGMTMFRMPLTIWALFITAILVLLATPVLAADLLMNLLDHQSVAIGLSSYRVTSFFEPYYWLNSNVPQQNSGGGYALLHQHLFWFYSHPAVYIMILPAMGMASDIIACFSRKPIFGYRPMVYATIAIALLGFCVWAHHMFQSGMNPALGTAFTISSFLIAVPSGVKVFNWLATLYGGDIHFTVPMCNALAFVAMFVIGGFSGIFLASTPVDAYLHATYFVVAHIHYVLFGASMFGIFAAVYFWYPKIFGRLMDNRLGYLHFFLTFIFFNLTFFPMHILGIRGMPRRYAGYMNISAFANLQSIQEFISISAFCLGLSQLPFIINFIGSWLWGKRAPANPWHANTLEWTDAPSPPPRGNFFSRPVVYRGAYEYSSPLVDEDYLPQSKLLDH